MRAAIIVILASSLASARPGTIIRIEHRDPGALPSQGPRTAPVTIELFFTPTAGGTVRYRQALDLQAAHPARIRLVFRIVTGGGQAMLPNAVLEAQAQGKYDELMTELTAMRSGPLTRPQLLELGTKAGLDPDRLAAAIVENRYERVLASNARRLRRRAPHAAPPIVLFNGRPTRAAIGDAHALETEYQDALARAEDLVDRGADPRALLRAFDALADDDAADGEIKVPSGQTDEELDQLPPAATLAQPPLDLHGLPSVGPNDAAITIVVACKPTSSNCTAPFKVARGVQDTYPDQVRVVWAPFFDVGSDDAPELALLGDAALCAERVGTETALDYDANASPGWQWVDHMLNEWQRRRVRHVAGAELIDKLGETLRVDARELAACRARTAGATIAWIERARHAGLKTSPATVVNGRIYGPITDPNALQALVAAELAGGGLDRLERAIGLDAWRR